MINFPNLPNGWRWALLEWNACWQAWKLIAKNQNHEFAIGFDEDFDIAVSKLIAYTKEKDAQQ